MSLAVKGKLVRDDGKMDGWIKTDKPLRYFRLQAGSSHLSRTTTEHAARA